MKKLIAASFLLMIFISQVGYYFIYSFQQHLIKEEMKEELLAALPDSALQVIIEEEQGNKLEWEEKGKEFYLDGGMYDVARIKHVSGKTFLYCLNDKKEKELLTAFSRSIHDRSNKQTIKNQSSTYIVYKTETETLPFSIPSQQFPDLAVSFRSSFQEIAAPPPKA